MGGGLTPAEVRSLPPPLLHPRPRALGDDMTDNVHQGPSRLARPSRGLCVRWITTFRNESA